MELSQDQVSKYTGMEFTQKSVVFGIYSNKYLCYLFEARIMTPSNIQKLESMLGPDDKIVKVEVVERSVITNAISGFQHSMGPNNKISPTAARMIESIPMGASFNALVGPSITNLPSVSDRRNLLIVRDCVQQGTHRLKRSQLNNLAAMLNALEIVADVETTRALTGKVSLLRG